MLPDAAPELDDADVARLWSAVWLRARRDARGRGDATPEEQREARDWFASGAALDLLLALGIEPKRAAAAVAAELEAINSTNGKGKR